MDVGLWSNPRALVTAGGIVVSVVPSTPVTNNSKRFTHLIHGDEMARNGAITPLEYSIAPTVNEIWYLKYVTIGIDDNGTETPDVYGSLATALLNGLELHEVVKGVDYIIDTMKKNTDLALAFNFPAAQIQGGGFLNSTKAFIGRYTFDEPQKILDGSTGDRMYFKVRDDLSLLSWHRASGHYWKVAP